MPLAGMLSTGDPPPVEVVNAAGISRLLITGDHAGNAVPHAMQGLGLPAGELERHIAWDIGVAGVARHLAARMNATAVLASYSRLLIDPNRSLGDAQSVPEASDGTLIVPNENISDAERCARAEALYWPYHKAIENHLARLQRGGCVPVLLALHSFTPALKIGAAPRPWQVGVLYGSDTRLARLLLDAFRARGDLTVGDNAPYSGVTHGYGLKVHGIAHGLPHAELEIRQDLIGDETGQRRWADLLYDVLTPLLAHPDIKAIEHR
jgi:predicted N-formylglutamate amidohydrolase